jgi:hypothetical protein
MRHLIPYPRNNFTFPKSPILKWIAQSLLLALLAIALQRFCHRQTDGFALHKILSSLPTLAETTDPSLLRECKAVSSVLQQPFYYLAKGAQCYTFASEDGSVVLKFFRHHRAEPLLGDLRFPFLEKKRIRYEKKRIKDFNSYALAYRLFKEESGLIFLHLHKGDLPLPQITLYDKIGVRHQLDLKNVEFILQKKAQLIYPTFAHWIKTHRMETCERALSSLVSLLICRCQKGIFDKDPDLNSNFGFLEDIPIQIDVGRFSKDNRRRDISIYRDEIQRITDHLKQWLYRERPPLSAFLEEEIQRQTARWELADE